jgi:Dolichol-phosphate mannosyltransferase subunit 3 (DPM3)
MKLLRYQIFLAYGVVFMLTWLMLLSRLPDDDAAPRGFQAVIIQYLPVWAILVLGLYAAGSVIYGVIIFRDTPKAAAELDVQIAEAVKEMKKRGVIQDAGPSVASKITIDKKDE